MTLNVGAHPLSGCVLLAALLLSGCARSSEHAKASGSTRTAGAPQVLKVGFQLDWYPAAEHGGHFQALAKNYYRDAGLDVTISAGGPGSFPLQKVATGRMQFAMGRCDDVILAVRQGLPLVIVCAQMQHDPQAIMVHDESQVRTFHDLDGKSVMANPGTNWIDYLQHHYGITFNVVPMDYGLARYMADKNFVQQCFISNEPYLAELKGAKTRAMLISNSGYDPYRVIFTSRAFAREHPEAVRAFVEASIHGWVDFLHGDSAAARVLIQAENPVETPAVMDYAVAAIRRFDLVEGDPAKGERMGLLTPARLSALVQILVDLKILDAAMPLEKFATFEFLPPELTAPRHLSRIFQHDQNQHQNRHRSGFPDSKILTPT